MSAANRKNTGRWQDARVGEAVGTDDGIEVTCTAVKSYTDRRGRTRKYLRFGRYAIWSTAKEFVLEERESWVHKECRKSRTQRAVVLYVELIIAKRPVDWMTIGLVYRSDQKRPDLTAKRLFKEELVKDMVRTELRKALSAKGISEEKVLEMYLGAYEKAAEVDKPSEMRSVANELARLLGMNAEKAHAWQEEEARITEQDMQERLEWAKSKSLPLSERGQLSEKFSEE